MAVQQERQHLLALGGAAPVLARTHGAHDHRVDDLQVRGVEGEREVDRAAWRGDVGREAHVVLHVAGMGAVGFGVFELALELIEQLARRLAERVDQRSEEHTSELQSLMRISYAVFCLKKKKNKHDKHQLRQYSIMFR